MRPIPRLRSSLGAAALALLLAGPAAAVDQKTVQQRFPLPAEGELRLANVAGRVELVPASGGEAEVEATVYAEGRSAAETQELLDGMSWIEGRDREGRRVWGLSYPVDEYRGFHYPRPGSRGDTPSLVERLLGSFNLGSQSSGYYMGRRVSVYGAPGSGVPTLYADLRIALPARGKVEVKNLVGPVSGGDLAGELKVDTGSGSVTLGDFTGSLAVDTGSGSVRVGRVRGETAIDTGSGGIEVAELVGNGVLDTGSGSVKVRKVAAGRLRIDTGSGSITVADGSATTLLADTGSGSIQVLGVEVEVFEGDTGSGSVTLESSLEDAREVVVDTGSGSVKILAGPDASFDLAASQGSGSLSVDYPDATLRKHGHKVVGAVRGEGRTRIRIDTGSGGVRIAPRP